jgi:flagellar protein FlbD
MITLHRLGHPTAALHLNDELIVSVEATPDTVITLTGGDKIVVADSPEEVCAKVRDCRIEILSGALMRRDAENAAAVERDRRPLTRPSLRALDPPPLAPVA